MENEGLDFERRLNTVLPVLERTIDPDNFQDVSAFLENGAAAELSTFSPYDGMADSVSLAFRN